MILPSLSWNFNNSGQELSNAITTLTSDPAGITLSENIANFQFDPVQAVLPHVKAFLSIQVLDYIAPGETITITSDVATIQLTADIAPSSSQFYTESAYINTPAFLQQQAESIADALNQSISFNSNYIITLSGAAITLTAKSYGATQYDLTPSSSVGAAIVNFSIQVGTSLYESQNQIDYSAFTELYIGDEDYIDLVDKNNSLFIDKYIIDSNISTANLAISNVKNYVDSILPNKLLSPTSDFFMMDQGVTTSGTLLPSLDNQGNQIRIIRPYFILYGDSFKYVVNGQKKKYTRGVSAVKWMQLGAFDLLLPYDMIDYTWIPNTSKTFKWLSSSPSYKSVTYDSHEYLQVIVQKSYNTYDFNLEVKYNFYDGLSTSISKPTHGYNQIAGNMSVDVSPLAVDVNGVELTNSKLVKSYEVKLVWDNVGLGPNVSEIREYFMDRNCYNDKKEVIFVNEFGAWDSLEFRGESDEELSRDISTIRRGLPFNANTNDAISTEVSLNISTDVDSLYTLRSGLMNEEHIEWIDKLGESSSVYIWDSSFNKYRNIIIGNFSYNNNSKIKSDSVEITFSYTTTNNSINR